MKRKKSFKIGSIVVFEPKNFNQDYWNGLSEKDRIKYYGPLGYGQKNKKLFCFLAPILDADGSDSGHCVLADLDDGKIEVMRHTSDFRKATEDEF
jgi:hypothetical protein